jgi:4,5-dihydroxyphthalate decarboxylase
MLQTSGRPTVKLGLRPWAHLMPLFAGLVAPGDFDLQLRACPETPDLLDEPGLDGAETSFSRYVLARGRGDDRLVGLPAFVMRSFRQRCFIVRDDSEIDSLEQLRGRRVGLTGWPDSGNTWTRALLRRVGLENDEIKWWLGPVARGDRPKHLDNAGLPPNVQVAAPGDSLLDGLAEGLLDAIMSPFTPADLQASPGEFRHLLPNLAEAEAAYFAEVGFVPGIHVVALKRELVSQHPWLPRAVLELLEESKRVWARDRRHYADATPWALQDLFRTERVFGSDWMPYGVEANHSMTAAFCRELHEQHISPSPVDASSVFADYARLETEHERSAQ